MTAQVKVSRRDSVAMSPFRYPGGKAFFADYLRKKLEELPPGPRTYLEPYAGGAGAAIRLLDSGVVDTIHLNDADIRVYHAWKAITAQNSRFIETLLATPVTISQWHQYKEIVDNPTKARDSFEIGFATFFLNRTNRSGIVQGAGPIGGYNQEGDWKLDVRFNRDSMVDRVRWIGRNARRIFISNLDGLKFIQSSSNVVDLEKSLYFIDPPYVSAGARLYLNGMKEKDHKRLGRYLCAGIVPNWVVTYDDSPLIRTSYAEANIENLSVLYSLQRKRLEGEILVTPKK